MRLTSIFALALLAACSGLDDYTTEPGEVYRGVVAGEPQEELCPVDVPDCSFIRRSFPSGTMLELTFDPDLATISPGTITTSGETCGPTFDDTALLPIAPLAHDQLGLYELPGGGRVRNYIFVARPTTGPLAGRDSMVFVSLLKSGGVEVRIIAGAAIDICNPTDCAALASGDCSYFGLFGLERETI